MLTRCSYRYDDFSLGEIQLGLQMTKGQVQLEVHMASNLPTAATGQPPDTYVKTYLKDGERRLLKKKTKVARHSCDPTFDQTIKYPAQEVLGRTLLVMVWERSKVFEHNQGIGVAEINLTKLDLKTQTTGWYRLLPITSIDRIDSDSGESMR
ncbi:regulating synaptic membrane exocytosis protein 4-like [Oratosquilla oratoria]|uniref:regulating synaptic membrane exocytosis protein 4-like n=1 Tax=Oratosquilla oratoria TaxID=337810 RepID=UPI003F76A845